MQTSTVLLFLIFVLVVVFIGFQASTYYVRCKMDNALDADPARIASADVPVADREADISAFDSFDMDDEEEPAEDPNRKSEDAPEQKDE